MKFKFFLLDLRYAIHHYYGEYAQNNSMSVALPTVQKHFGTIPMMGISLDTQ